MPRSPPETLTRALSSAHEGGLLIPASPAPLRSPWATARGHRGLALTGTPAGHQASVAGATLPGPGLWQLVGADSFTFYGSGKVKVGGSGRAPWPLWASAWAQHRVSACPWCLMRHANAGTAGPARTLVRSRGSRRARHRDGHAARFLGRLPAQADARARGYDTAFSVSLRRASGVCAEEEAGLHAAG